MHSLLDPCPHLLTFNHAATHQIYDTEYFRGSINLLLCSLPIPLKADSLCSLAETGAADLSPAASLLLLLSSSAFNAYGGRGHLWSRCYDPRCNEIVMGPRIMLGEVAGSLMYTKEEKD